MSKILLLILAVFTVLSNSYSQQGNPQQDDLQLFADNVFHLSEVMLHDVASPPAASRFYAYSLLGAYEVALLSQGKIPNLNSKVNVTPSLQSPSLPRNFNLLFCATYAMLDVGRQIMPSGRMLIKNQEELLKYFIEGKILSQRDASKQIEYAEEITKQIIAYAKTDGYGKLSTYRRYTPSKDEGRWYPTPPEYMSPVEPKWETIRSFFLDSANQFSPEPPATFSKDTTSSFYQQMKEVYNVVKDLSEDQMAIASFWDCNPETK
jgi:hypothetical protein